MLFAEEMNAYFGGTSHGNHTNSSAANSMEMPVPWKPPGAHASEIGYSDGSGSKLVTKWGGHHPMAVGDYGPKNGHQEQPVMGHPFTPNFAGGHGGFAWNEPTFQFPPQQQQDQANVFHPSMTPQQTGTGPGHFTPPVEIVNGQWGRAEINQTTPWNMEMNGGMPDQNNQQQQYQRNRKWDQQQREENAQFNAGGYGTPTTPYGMPGYNNERMMPGGNFPAQFGGPNSRAPPQRWDGMGHAGGKFGAAAEMAPAGPNSQQRGGGGPLFSGPPPPLHSMGMMPPRPNHIMGHMPPPPLLPSLNPHGGMGQFNVNTFAPTGPNIQTASISDDSVWQDPNGELRKWQRDTGTSIWGDPMKQVNILIQRWQQFTADEVVAKSSILKEGEIVEGGWGDLPPIGSNANNSNNGNSNNVNNSAGNGNGGSQQPFMTSQSQHNQQQPQHPHKSQQQRVQSAVGNTGSAWGQDNQLNGANWERIEQQQQNAPVHAGQFFVNQSTASGGVAAQQGNFVLPPSTSSNAQQQQQSMFQPPSLLSSIIDSGTNEAAGEQQQQQQHGGQPQRKATSPNGSSQQQASKVSLAEELSSLGGTHSLGGGQIW